MAIAISLSVRCHLARSARFVVALLILCGSAEAPASGVETRESIADKRSTYMNVWHTYQMIREGPHWTMHRLSASSVLGDDVDGDSGWEILTSSAVDCSDDRVTCVTSDFYVFAVPKSGLDQQPFEARGVRFRVEKCIRDSSTRCSVALLSGTCDQFSEVSEDDEVHCLAAQPKLGERSMDVAYVLYFVYNQNVGVTAFGIAPRPLASEAEQLSVVTQAVLASESGLLCCDP